MVDEGGNKITAMGHSFIGFFLLNEGPVLSGFKGGLWLWSTFSIMPAGSLDKRAVLEAQGLLVLYLISNEKVARTQNSMI